MLTLSSLGVYWPLFVPGLLAVLVALDCKHWPQPARWMLSIVGAIFLLGAMGCGAAHAGRRRLAPNCLPCSRVPPYRNCVPSSCVRYPGGNLCCLGGRKNLPEPLAPPRERGPQSTTPPHRRKRR